MRPPVRSSRHPRRSTARPAGTRDRDQRARTSAEARRSRINVRVGIASLCVAVVGLVVSSVIAVLPQWQPNTPAEYRSACEKQHAAPYRKQFRADGGGSESRYGSCVWPPPPGADESGFSAVRVVEHTIPGRSGADRYTSVQVIESRCTTLFLRYRFSNQGGIAQEPIRVDNDQIVWFLDGRPELLPPEMRDVVGWDSAGRLIVLAHFRYELVSARCAESE